ncbi:hypothetical protein HYFRA_00004300 [Hymenoscyphus fraxineus]|uniref:Extracellular membrane protein CFEM domain-containing protein n=1 Tax=Hymenoscyphus fraxineus TaxID=746836 RepID=A0A9N9KN12_9HELO|nr:hypothetical protein HYFRA_00004300 [Hymenoscyphus fraxineus]
MHFRNLILALAVTTATAWTQCPHTYEECADGCSLESRGGIQGWICDVGAQINKCTCKDGTVVY